MKWPIQSPTHADERENVLALVTTLDLLQSSCTETPDLAAGPDCGTVSAVLLIRTWSRRKSSRGGTYKVKVLTMNFSP